MKFQKFHSNRIKYLILILLSIVFLPSVKAIVSPTSNFYVNDYANILSEETEQYIMNRSVALNNVDGTQIVVVTVNNLEGMSLENYATQLFRNFGIGDKQKNNGLLLLLALEEREFRVEVGYGLEGILPDGKTGRFQDQYIIPYLRNNNWDEGIKNGYDAFYKEIVTLNNLNIEYIEPVDMQNDNMGEAELVFSLIMIFGIIGLILGACIRNLDKKVLLTLIYITIIFLIIYRLYVNESLYIIWAVVNLIFFLVGRFVKFDSSYSGGRGSSRSSYGGSSFRSSSSRSFSGGGGRSGGGGSSRRF